MLSEISRKILFVDDEPNVLKAFRRQCRKQLEIYTAAGGEEGMEMVRNQGPFAVAVSDLRMEGMDGLTFLRQVHKLSPDIIYISSFKSL